MIALFDALAVEHPYQSASHNIQKLYLKNLDGSLKNLLALDHLRDPTCVYSKRVRHIWLILTLLTLFSFQRTLDRFLRTNISLTHLFHHVNILFFFLCRCWQLVYINTVRQAMSIIFPYF